MYMGLPGPELLEKAGSPATSNSENHHNEQAAQKQGRKVWSLDTVTVEQAQGGTTGSPNPEELKGTQKTPDSKEAKGMFTFALDYSAQCPKNFTHLFNKPREGPIINDTVRNYARGERFS